MDSKCLHKDMNCIARRAQLRQKPSSKLSRSMSQNKENFGQDGANDSDEQSRNQTEMRNTYRFQPFMTKQERRHVTSLPLLPLLSDMVLLPNNENTSTTLNVHPKMSPPDKRLSPTPPILTLVKKDDDLTRDINDNLKDMMRIKTFNTGRISQSQLQKPQTSTQ